MTPKAFDKSYIRYLESELMAQKQTIEMYREKEKISKEYDERKKQTSKNDGYVLASVNTHVLNYENGVFGAEVTINKIGKAIRGHVANDF